MRLAVIGMGSMGSRRLRHLCGLSNGPIAGMDERADRRRPSASLSALDVLASKDQLLAWRPDAIFVCTPPSQHFSYMRLAADRGWHFMVENPAVHRLEGLDELIRDVEDRGIVTQVGCNLRFDACVCTLRGLVESKAVGKVLTGMVEIGEWLPDWHPWEPYTEYYPSRKSMGGGLDAICEMDWLADLFGPIDRALALAGKRSSLEIDTDDVVQMLLEFKDGPQVVLHCDMLQRPFSHRAKFVGEEGVILVEFERRLVHLYRAREKKWTEYSCVETGAESVGPKAGAEWAEKMYRDETSHFLNCLRGEDRPLNTLRDNKNLLSVLIRSLGWDQAASGGVPS